MSRIKEKIKECTIKDIYYWLYIFLILYLCRDSLISTIILDFKGTFIITLIVSIPNLYYFIKTIKNNKGDYRLIFIAGILILSILVSMFWKGDFQLYNLSLLVFISIGCITAYTYGYQKFIKCYVWIMIGVSLYSLFSTYIAKPIVINNNIPVQLIENSENNKFYNFIFSFAMWLPFYIRNNAFFREPGVYQVFLIIALIFQLFCNTISSKKVATIVKTLILIITVISTFSTTGIAVLAIVLITYFIKLIEERTINVKILITLLTVLIMLATVLFTLYVNNPFFKRTIDLSIGKVFSGNASITARVNSIIKPLELYLKSPIIGHTFKESVEVTETANTNTNINMFNIYGVIPGAIVMWLVYLLIKKLEQKKITTIFLFIAVLIAINTQFLIGNLMLWVLLFSYFMENNENNQHIIKNHGKRMKLNKKEEEE